MKKVLCFSTLASLVLSVGFVGLYHINRDKASLALSITAVTVFYHLAMRLLVGTVILAIFHNRMNHTRRWFRERRFEPSLYRFLQVRRWKRFVPTYDPATFSPTEHTPRDIIGATCQSEVVHEIIMVLSFLPLVAIPAFGEPLVFALTSVAACLVDATFVILQRYNRPRLVRVMERQAARAAKNEKKSQERFDDL